MVSEITEKAKVEGASFEQKVKEIEIDDTTSIFTDVMKTQPPLYKLDNQFKESAKSVKLPQFFIKVDPSELSEISLFKELNSEDQFLNKESLLNGFKLSNHSSHVTFEEISKEIYAVDFNKEKGTATAGKVSKRAKDILVDTILSKPKESQISQVSGIVVSKLGDMTPISEQELKKYVFRVFDNLSNDQIRDIVDNDFIYVKKVKDKIQSLSSDYAKERFKVLIDSNKIIVKENFEFPDTISPINKSTAINKSLYETEGNMNNFEQKMIMDVAALENVSFWHRNLERGKGFHLNGFNKNHYPDFIIYTKKGNIILLETKGDVYDNDDSRDKNILGKTWAEKCGDNFKYFMVFESKEVENTYTARSVIEVLKGL